MREQRKLGGLKKNFSKKGQGLSMTTIIVAALALIVLVVLTTIFIGRIGNWRQSSEACENNGGACIDNGQSVCQGEYERVIQAPCFKYEKGKKTVDTDKICCVRT